MYFSHISIGGGVTGIETIISAFTKIQEELIKSQKKRKKFKFKKFILEFDWMLKKQSLSCSICLPNNLFDNCISCCR